MKKNNMSVNRKFVIRAFAVVAFAAMLFSVAAPAAVAWSFKDFVPVRLRLASAQPADEQSVFVLPSDGNDSQSSAKKAGEIKPKAEYVVDSTAYTSSVEECDSDPFTTADGSTTRDGIIAANFLPFGTKVKIPSLFGDRIFEVHDRMNKRYWYRIDVWMKEKKDMREYGIHKNVTIQIVEWGNGETQWKRIAAENIAKKKIAAEKAAAEKKLAIEQK